MMQYCKLFQNQQVKVEENIKRASYPRDALLDLSVQ
jgi:hypothetical protein